MSLFLAIAFGSLGLKFGMRPQRRASSGGGGGGSSTPTYYIYGF